MQSLGTKRARANAVALTLGACFYLALKLTSSAEIITFDDVNNSQGNLIPNGYANLNWNNFYASSGDVPNSGYLPGTVSNPNVAYNGFGSPSSISSDTPFSFQGGYFTGAWNEGLNITIQGLNGTSVLDSTTFSVSSTSPTLETFNWNGLTQLTFNSFGGTPNPAYSSTGSGTQFALDNLMINGGITPPSLLELAMLSGNAYGGNAGVDGYHYLFDNAQVGINKANNGATYPGFRAAAYMDGSQIVVAIRGTDLQGSNAALIKNAVADTSFVNGKVNADMVTSVDLALQFLSYVQAQYPGAEITLTGHSLGGAIAQLLSKATGYSAEVFDAPGSAQLYSTLFPTTPALQCASSCGHDTNYRYGNDLVSLVGTQIGGTESIAADPSTNYSAPQSPPLFLLANYQNVLDSHSIASIESQLSSGDVFSASAIDPSLFQDAVGLEEVVFPTDTFNAIEDTLDPTRLFLRSVFNLAVDAGNKTYLLDPSPAYNYTFIESPGSPLLSCVTLPTMQGVGDYDVSYLMNDTWSSVTDIQPGASDCFDGNSVDGFMFNADDSSGNDTLLPQSLIFGVDFADAGTFDGDLIAEVPNTTVPEANTWLIFLFGIGFTTFLRRMNGLKEGRSS